MATNWGRLPTTKRFAALCLAVGVLCPTPAAAEIPRTTAEWLAVYKERQTRFDAVEIESHWQRLEGEKVIEEWDQTFYDDDLGRLRLEEKGILERNGQRPGVAFVTDKVFAFDGAEYRELYTRWEYVERLGRSSESLAKLRATPPKAHQSRIDAQAGDHASIRRADTPFTMCDFWFLVCLDHAAQAKLEPRTSPVLGKDDLWVVTFDSPRPDWGHKCRAVVHAGQDNHVIQLDIWADGGWAFRFEVTYALKEDRWLPSHGRMVQLPRAGRAQSSKSTVLRFYVVTVELARRLPDAAVLPTLPVGTRVWDRRTDATYVVGREGTADAAIERLDGIARHEFGRLQGTRAAYFGWRGQFAIIALYASVGALLGFGLGATGTLGRRFLVRWTRHLPSAPVHNSLARFTRNHQGRLVIETERPRRHGRP